MQASPQKPILKRQVWSVSLQHASDLRPRLLSLLSGWSLQGILQATHCIKTQEVLPLILTRQHTQPAPVYTRDNHSVNKEDRIYSAITLSYSKKVHALQAVSSH